jgi:hypothetical protein
MKYYLGFIECKHDGGGWVGMRGWANVGDSREQINT